MKMKITCPKCSSTNVDIIAEEGNPLPMYKCAKCGYKKNLFPQFGNKEKEEEETRPGDAVLEEED